MKKLGLFILFLAYTIGIFFINNYIILGCIFAFNLLLILILKIDFLSVIKNTLKLLPFIIFTSVINLLFTDLQFSLLIGVRLILVCNISYIYSKTITCMEFSEVIEKLMFPLKIFGINPKEIGLIISISISFIPIMKDEISEVKYNLKVKGIKPTKYNILKNSGLIFKPFFVSVLQRMNEIEMALRAKGYQE